MLDLLLALQDLLYSTMIKNRRFDFWYDGEGEPKLLEYNADTPTTLFEASVIQHYWFQDFDASQDQFNSIHEKLLDLLQNEIYRSAGRDTFYFASVKKPLKIIQQQIICVILQFRQASTLHKYLLKVPATTATINALLILTKTRYVFSSSFTLVVICVLLAFSLALLVLVF